MGGHVCPQRRHPFPDQEPPVQLCLDLSVSENGAVIRMVYVFMKAVVQGEMTGKAQQVRLDGCLFFRILLLFPGLYAMEKSTRAGSSWSQKPLWTIRLSFNER